MIHDIRTPRGEIVVTPGGKAELKWNTGFGRKWSGQYNRSQKFIDSEVLRLSEPYTPLLTGTLVKSGLLGTDIGSGEVKWIAPYSRFQYYASREPGSMTGPLRGPYWFERMKQTHVRQIVNGARQIAGGGR